MISQFLQAFPKRHDLWLLLLGMYFVNISVPGAWQYTDRHAILKQHLCNWHGGFSAALAAQNPLTKLVDSATL